MRLETEQPKIHRISASIKKGEDAATTYLLDKCYRRQFGTMLKRIERIDYDKDEKSKQLQLSGVDVILHLAWEFEARSFEKQITIDEKRRGPDKYGNDYTDILCEIWSSKEHKTPGWIFKPGADYIAYCFKKSRLCYLIPHILYLRWVVLNWSYVMRLWDVPGVNPMYTTISKPIPVDVLLDGIKEIMCVPV